MRELLEAPSSILDPVTHAPRTGSYRGPLPKVDLEPLGKGSLYRLTHTKRWMYVAIASPDLYLGLAVIHLGYVMTAFVFAFDKASHSMLVDRSAMGPTLLGAVGDTAGEGCRATFSLGATAIRVLRCKGDRRYCVEAEARDLKIQAKLGSDHAPPPLAVVADVPGGVVNTTEKRCLLPVSGEAIIKGKRYSLDNALAGYDYTHGLLARRTAWRWGFGLGYATTGEKVGFNLTEGFVGEPECAVWIDDELHPLAEGRFSFDRDNPLASWSVKSADGGVDLAFSPGGMHHEQKNFGVIASRFVQPAGTFSGTIKTATGRSLVLDRVLGVTEDQDVLW